MEQKPSIGRIVHFNDGPEGTEMSPPPRAAIITGVMGTDKQHVCLTVFPPNGGPFPRYSVPYSETPKTGYWSWPPRSEK